MNFIRQRYSPLPSPPPDRFASNSDLSRFALKLGSFKGQEQPVAASFPSPPMSGSPPPPTPPEASRTSSLTHKRSVSPSAATGPVYQPATSAPREHYATTSRPADIQPYSSSTFAPHLPSLVSAYQTAGNYPPPPQFQPTYGSGYLGGHSGVQGPSLFPPGATLPSQHETSASRAARKPKAHVASACVNCKKKHLRCDNARPCRRCVQSGKEDSCVDVTHKKRGRPPLKADDNPPRRPYETSLGSLAAPAVSAASRQAPTSQPFYGQQSALPAPRGLAPLPSPEERRRPPPLFQPFQAPALPQAGQPYQQGKATPTGPTGHRHFSSESSSSSTRPLSPYFSSPLHSPLGIPQQRLDAYGRPYPVPGSSYTLPASQASQQRPYHSIASLTVTTGVSMQHPQPAGMYGQLPQPGSTVQLPPLQQHQISHQPGHYEHPRAPASSGSSERSGPSQHQEGQRESTPAREAKRQRMDLGGMLRRTTEP